MLRLKKPTKPARKKPAPKPKAPLSAWQQWTAKPDEALASLCNRIEDGESLKAIAGGFDIDESTLRHWIGADMPRSARVREARAKSAAAFDQMALDAIRQASDPFGLAKAKEEAHHLRWRASKINPRDYGDKLDVTQDVTIRDVSDAELAAKLAKFAALMAGGPG